MRLLQKKLEWKYSVEKIQNALNSANARVLKGDLYINNKISVLSKEICKEFGFDL
jgi:hypothetical protein